MSQPTTASNPPSRIRHQSSHRTAIDIIRASGEAHGYHNLPKERDRTDVRTKLQAMLDIDRLIDQERMTKKQAVRITAARLKPFHPRGFSASILGNYHKLWRKGGQKQDARGRKAGPVYQPRDWKLFIPNYTNGKTDSALRNKEFVDYVRGLMSAVRDDAQGNALHDRLLDDWFAGKHIPGFGTIQQFCARQGRPVPEGYLARSRPENYPEGWSPKNLLRMRPDKTTSVYIRKGEHAAHSHWGDQLLRDRSKLMPLELITFDDVRFDIRVIMEFPNRPPQIVNPEAIFCLDVGTGVILAKAVTGNYVREADGDGGKKGTKRGLQQADMRWLMKAVLELYGLPRDWRIHALLENASASLGEADKRIFTESTGIQFDETGVIRNKLTNSDFIEQGGMPWQKGWIEAFFRLMHCRINHLPMTVGSRYDLTPGRIGGASKAGSMEHYVLKTCLEAHEKGIPLKELKLPALTLDQFHTLLDEYILRLNWRTRHNLQGFEKVYEHELNPGQYVRTDDPQHGHLIPSGIDLGQRMEAPAERICRLAKGHQFDPVHPHMLRPLGMHKQPITVAAQRVQIDLPGEKKLIFRDQDSAHMLAQFNGQKKALLGVLAHDNSCIHLFTNDEALQHVGSPRRVGHVDITDEHALDVRMGEVHRGRQAVRDYASEMLAEQDAQLQADRDYTANILSQSKGERLATPAAQAMAETVRTTETKQAKANADRRRANKISDADADEYFAVSAIASQSGADTDAEEESPF
jgi:hypothetical protein